MLLVVSIQDVKIAGEHQQHGQGMVGDFRALDNFVIGERDVAVAQIVAAVFRLQNVLNAGAHHSYPFQVLTRAHFG